MNRPDMNDVVIRKKDGPPSAYAVGTMAAPDQFTLRTRDEAVAHAVTFARRLQLRAWLAKGDDEFVLLGSYVPVKPSEKVYKLQ